MNIAIIGLGLIGGSIGIRLKQTHFFDKIIGVEKNETHQKKALQLGLVDEIQPLSEAINNSKVIVLTVPVDTILNLLPEIMEHIDEQVVKIGRASCREIPDVKIAQKAVTLI